MNNLETLYELLTGELTEKSKFTNNWKFLKKVFKQKDIKTFKDLDFYLRVGPLDVENKGSYQLFPIATLYFDNDLGIKVEEIQSDKLNTSLTYKVTILNRNKRYKNFSFLLPKIPSYKEDVDKTIKYLQEYD